jgi:hypothetical protein
MVSWGSEQWLLSYGSRELGGENMQNPVTTNYFANSSTVDFRPKVHYF